MSSEIVDELIKDYLARLDRVAHQLPRQRRVELVQEIAGHIAAARAAGTADEAAARTVLDRLGEPEEIVASAAWDPPPGAAPASGRSALGRFAGPGWDLAAVVALLVGALIGLVLPTAGLVGWIVAVGLLWFGSGWSRLERVLGALVVLGAAGVLIAIAGGGATQTCSAGGSGTAGVPGGVVVEHCASTGSPPWFVLVALLGIPVTVWSALLVRARRRGGAGHPGVEQAARR